PGRRPVAPPRQIEPFDVEEIGIIEQEQCPRAGDRVQQTLRRIFGEGSGQIERVLVRDRQQSRPVAQLPQLAHHPSHHRRIRQLPQRVGYLAAAASPWTSPAAAAIRLLYWNTSPNLLVGC